jgi:hypothetical protein
MTPRGSGTVGTMAGEKQMVPGFNHNVKHKGTPYHVQTEDSGIDNPRIVTHLFVGGNIIASKKTSYADIVGAENLAQVVRELMEEQHKEMLRNLVSGVYDDTDEEVAAKSRAFQPGQIVPGAQRAAQPPPEPARVAARPPEPEGVVPARPPEVPRASAAMPPPIRRQAPRDAKPDLPGRPSAPEQPTERAAVPQPAAAPATHPGRPAAVRRSPAAANGQAPAAAAPPRRDSAEGLFGEDLISEKSLDEVILSYLAEDLVQKS